MIESITWHAPVQDARGADDAVPDLSIVIVSWNVREDLLNCLHALFSPLVRDALSVEVIVVDNASHDGSAEAAAAFPVTLIRNDENLGYGRANNMGLRIARGRHLMVLNPDTIPQHQSLRALVDFADSQRRVGIVAPRLLNADGSVQTAAFNFPTLPMALLDLFPPPTFLPGRLRLRVLNSRLNGRYPDEPERVHPFKIDHPLGAAFLLSREAYEQCGGFDESIFMYSEEIDLALRYASAGWECWQVPAASVIHLGGQSTRQVPDTMFVELWRSRLQIYHRYYSPPSRLLLRLLLGIAMLRDIGFARVATLRSHSNMHTAGRMRRAKAVLRLALKR
ncbi:MAG: glycosyltransferase family 2 protein [Chloroflexia bacterium]